MSQISNRFALIAVGAALVLAGCGGGASGEDDVRAACASYEKAGPQTIETVGPILTEMASQAQAAADANSEYQAFADAAAVFRDILSESSDGSEEDFEAQYNRLIEANAVVDETCKSLD